MVSASPKSLNLVNKESSLCSALTLATKNRAPALLKSQDKHLDAWAARCLKEFPKPETGGELEVFGFQKV